MRGLRFGRWQRRLLEGLRRFEMLSKMYICMYMRNDLDTFYCVFLNWNI
jgi:hypothetical protein